MTYRDSTDDLMRLIVQFFRQGDALAALGGEAGELGGFVLHSMNLERLVTLEYVRLGRAGRIAPFLAKPTLREKCEAVLAALRAEGYHGSAVTAERFSVLMPAFGAVKHAMYPRVAAIRERISWVREATADLFGHYFGERIPA